MYLDHVTMLDVCRKLGIGFLFICTGEGWLKEGKISNNDNKKSIFFKIG